MLRSAICRPVLLAWIPVVALLCLGAFILNRPFCHMDEYFTAERTREMSITGNYITVHQNFYPNFNKPPLYYALSSFWADLFPREYWTAKALSFAYGLGCILFCFLITRRLAPDSFWAAPVSALLPAISNAYIFTTGGAFLDTGQAFYLLLACYALIMPPSRRRDAAIFCAVALGALHKLPLAMLFVLLAAAVDWATRNPHPLIGKRQILIIGAALLPPLLWIAYHLAVYGFRFIDNLFVREIWERTTDPDFTQRIGRTELSIYWKELGSNWFYLGWPASLAALCYLLIPSWRKQHQERLLSLFYAISLCVLLAMVFKSARYFVFLVPLGSILLGCALARLLQKRPKTFAGLYLLLCYMMVHSLVQVGLSKRWGKLSGVLPAIHTFREELLPDETPVLIRGQQFIQAQFFYEAGLDRHAAVDGRIWALETGTRLRGLSARKKMKDFEPCFSDIRILDQSSDTLYFTAIRNSRPAPLP